MISYIPISILAYVLNAGSILIDKALIKKSLPSPIIYTFYVNILQVLTVVLIPFGFTLSLGNAALLAISSGIFSFLALYAFFVSLKLNEASVVGPVVGALNPFFSLVLGGLFLGQILTGKQYLAFFILIIGALILTANLWMGKLHLDKRLLWMILAGLLFAISYVLLRQAFLYFSFINGLIYSRVAAGFAAALLLLHPLIRQGIFHPEKQASTKPSKVAFLLLLAGQGMGAVQGFLIAFAVSLASPALVNAFFGVQFLVILIVSLLLSKNHPELLEEKLTKKILIQKITGAIILTLGLYLLA